MKKYQVGIALLTVKYQNSAHIERFGLHCGQTCCKVKHLNSNSGGDTFIELVIVIVKGIDYSKKFQLANY